MMKRRFAQIECQDRSGIQEWKRQKSESAKYAINEGWFAIWLPSCEARISRSQDKHSTLPMTSPLLVANAGSSTGTYSESSLDAKRSAATWSATSGFTAILDVVKWSDGLEGLKDTDHKTASGRRMDQPNGWRKVKSTKQKKWAFTGGEYELSGCSSNFLTSKKGSRSCKPSYAVYSLSTQMR